MAAPDLVYVINLPLSQQAYDELIDLQDLLSDITYEPEENDRWSFIWDNDKYSSKKLYTLAFSTMHAPITFSWMWKSQCTLRIKVFAWLLLVDRLNTRVMLRRRNFNIQTGIECVLYDTGIDEDVNHLLFACPFATRCWQKLQIHWDLSLDTHLKIIQAKETSQLPFFHGHLSDRSLGNLEATKCSDLRRCTTNFSSLDCAVQRASTATTPPFQT